MDAPDEGARPTAGDGTLTVARGSPRSTVLGRVLSPLLGRPIVLPDALLARFPELSIVRFRRGGLPPHVGGWALLQRSAAAITLWRTVFLAPETPLDPGLLLHEFRHVQQFASSAWFPLAYLWGSIRRGYYRNPFELDAEQFAVARLAGPRAAAAAHAAPVGATTVPPSPDV